jgi:hypothetical protein
MERQNDVAISARVPARLKKLVKEFLSHDCHMNESDFFETLSEKKSNVKHQNYTTNFSKRVIVDSSRRPLLEA